MFLKFQKQNGERWEFKTNKLGKINIVSSRTTDANERATFRKR
jgi:hypothetical protein